MQDSGEGEMGEEGGGEGGLAQRRSERHAAQPARLLECVTWQGGKSAARGDEEDLPDDDDDLE